MTADVDIKTSFMYRVLSRLIDQRVISRSDKILIIGCGRFDEAVVLALGLANVIATNINAGQMNVKEQQVQDARYLQYADDAFDCVFTHATLHHVDRPHQAVCEMYRVARKAAIFFEAQDSFLMRVAARLGVVTNYEMNAIRDSGWRRGGVNDTVVPNYVYRWTQREVEKLIRTLDPAHEPQLHFETEWDVSWQRIARRLKNSPVRVLGEPFLAMTAKIGMGLANYLLSSQGNMFAACILKCRARLQPWMAESEGRLIFRDELRK
jgi:ubiquinone/menaquinone biosynthesis C-methylase UbiE